MRICVEYFVLPGHPLAVEMARYPRSEYKSFRLASRYGFQLIVKKEDIHILYRWLVEHFVVNRNDLCVAPFIWGHREKDEQNILKRNHFLLDLCHLESSVILQVCKSSGYYIIRILSRSFDSAQDTIWPSRDRDIIGYGYHSGHRIHFGRHRIGIYLDTETLDTDTMF